MHNFKHTWHWFFCDKHVQIYAWTLSRPHGRVAKDSWLLKKKFWCQNQILNWNFSKKLFKVVKCDWMHSVCMEKPVEFVKDIPQSVIILVVGSQTKKKGRRQVWNSPSCSQLSLHWLKWLELEPSMVQKYMCLWKKEN